MPKFTLKKSKKEKKVISQGPEKARDEKETRQSEVDSFRVPYRGYSSGDASRIHY